MRSRRSFWVDHAVGAALAVLYVAVLLATVRGLGYARDEGFYFQAATSYAHWFEQLLQSPSEALSRASVDPAWSNNHEHPSLVKSVFALSWLFLYKRWHLFSEEGTSFRFGGMLFAGLGLWLVYLWGARARSRRAGLAAALLFATMPRVFYHAHLDCFDVPITVMWLLCAYVYWRAMSTRSWGWALATGLVFGLALATKHNAWFLPAALGLHAFLARRRAIGRIATQGFLALPSPLVAMVLLGPVVFVLLWPWLWFDTFDRINGYIQFHLHHDYYNIVFLGVTYWKPPFPWTYPWVMTAATVPTVTLVLFFVGGASLLFERVPVGVRRLLVPVPKRGDASLTAWLWAIGFFTQYAPWILSRSTPIFGGTKHWMPAYPFLCLFAGHAFDLTVQKARAWVAARRERWGGLPAELAVGACLLAAPLVETVHSHPWGLSNYSPLVGGASGAASLGLNRQFWGFTTGAVADVISSEAKVGHAVFVHDTALQSWDMMQRDHTLPPYARPTLSIEQSELALYHHEEHMEGVEYQIWQVYGTASPVHVGTYDGVPVVYLYRRPR